MRPHGYAFGTHGFAKFIGVVPRDVKNKIPPRNFAVSLGGNGCYARRIGNQFTQQRAQFVPSLDYAAQLVQLREANRALHFGHAIVGGDKSVIAVGHILIIPSFIGK